jgi:superfamily I DNA/RNA helicase
MTYRLVRRPVPGAVAVSLDPVQTSVVAHVDGPLLVVGGPGTGKTTALVEAVAARVAEGIPPDQILVLTFGRRGAARLRSRIESRIATPGQAMVEPLVRTFHAYAYGLLRRAAAERGEPAPRLLTGPEQDLVIRELLADDAIGWPAGLAPALRTRAFAGQLRDLLLRSAERGVDAEELRALGLGNARPDWVAAAAFLREYDQVLALRDATGRTGAAFDNAELIRAAAGLLADDPALLTAERHRLSCVYVDELADTDPAQIDLLELIAGGGAHLVAFADPDSSTYAFRGADPAAISAFPDRFAMADGRPASCSAGRTAPGLACSPRPRGSPPGCAAPPATARWHPTRRRRPSSAPRSPPRCTPSARAPAKPPMSRTGCARRTCSTACRGTGWRSSSGRPRWPCPRCGAR